MTLVWAVHVVKRSGAQFAEVVFDDVVSAGEYARERSGDPGVVAAAVTRFVLGEFGARSTATWYESGVVTAGRGAAAAAS